MDDEPLLRLMRKTLSRDEYKALTHEHGPYSITRPNHSIARLAELLRAEVLEEAARLCDVRAGEIQEKISKGKGVWPHAGYVKDETWNNWRGQWVASEQCAAAIRAAKEGS